MTMIFRAVSLFCTSSQTQDCETSLAIHWRIRHCSQQTLIDWNKQVVKLKYRKYIFHMRWCHSLLFQWGWLFVDNMTIIDIIVSLLDKVGGRNRNRNSGYQSDLSSHGSPRICLSSAGLHQSFRSFCIEEDFLLVVIKENQPIFWSTNLNMYNIDSENKIFF